MFKITVADFISGCEWNPKKLYDEIRQFVSPNVGPQGSFEEVSKTLAEITDNNPVFGNVTLLFEYKPPCYPGYCDVILLGKKDDIPCAYVIELKNWDNQRQCEAARERRRGNRRILYNGVPCDHPSAQVEGYVTALRESHSAVVQPNGYNKPQVRGVVFFTNNDFDDVSLATYRQRPFDGLTADYPVFNNREMLAEDIEDFIAEGDDAFANEFLKGAYTQSYELKQFVCHAIQNYLEDREAEKPFVLSVRQDEVFEALFDALKEALENPQKKQVFVVKGQPGTGKTAVAVNLLVEALKLAGGNPGVGNVIFTSATTNAKTWGNIFNSDNTVLINTKEFNPGINGNNNDERIRQYQNSGFGHLIFDDNGRQRFITACWREIFAVLRDEKMVLRRFVP